MPRSAHVAPWCAGRRVRSKYAPALFCDSVTAVSTIRRADARREALFVLPDCPGYFTHIAAGLAERVRAAGVDPVFAVTSRYYMRFKGVDLDSLGPVYDISEFLRRPFAPDRLARVEIDYWDAHATYVRLRYFEGAHLNAWDDYRKLSLFYADLFKTHPRFAAVWSEWPSSATLSFAHRQASLCGTPYLGYASSRVPRHFEVATDALGVRLLPNPTPPAERPGEDEIPDYMHHPESRLADRPLLDLFRDQGTRLVRAASLGREHSIEVGNPALHQVRAFSRVLQRKLNHEFLTRVSGTLSGHTHMPDGPCVVFPLHLRPEASTSVQTREYADDAEVIRNLAFSLPHGAYLCVREHPAAVGQRRRAFYEEVLSYPNVKLLGIDFPMRENLARFRAVACLTSTMGFEALQKGIPVLLFGRASYEDFPGVIRIRSYDQVGEALARVCHAERMRVPDGAMQRYLNACFPGNFSYLDAATAVPKNLDLLARPLLLTLNAASHAPGA